MYYKAPYNTSLSEITTPNFNCAGLCNVQEIINYEFTNSKLCFTGFYKISQKKFIFRFRIPILRNTFGYKKTSRPIIIKYNSHQTEKLKQ